MGLLDLLFPKKCVSCRKIGEYVCPSCFSQISFDVPTKCLVCEKPSLDGLTHPKCQTKFAIDGYVAGVAYKKVMKKLLYQFKYQPYLFDLQSVLTDLLYENLIQNEQFAKMLQSKPILVPIPLSKNKLRKRGYNQAELLAKGLSKKFGLEVKAYLKRAKETKHQYGLSREERMDNIKGAFEMSSKISSPTKTALLVDDVLTTGSTLKEAAKVLKKNGFERVWGVVLAQD